MPIVLNDNQLAFLAARPNHKSDNETCQAIGVHHSRATRWRQGNEEFRIAYRRVLAGMAGEIESYESELVARRVRRKLEFHADEITDELLQLVQEGKPHTKMMAIKLSLEVLGVIGAKKISVKEIGPNLKQAVAALAPTYKAVLAGEDVVEGEVVEED